MRKRMKQWLRLSAGIFGMVIMLSFLYQATPVFAEPETDKDEADEFQDIKNEEHESSQEKDEGSDTDTCSKEVVGIEGEPVEAGGESKKDKEPIQELGKSEEGKEKEAIGEPETSGEEKDKEPLQESGKSVEEKGKEAIQELMGEPETSEEEKDKKPTQEPEKSEGGKEKEPIQKSEKNEGEKNKEPAKESDQGIEEKGEKIDAVPSILGETKDHPCNVSGIPEDKVCCGLLNGSGMDKNYPDEMHDESHMYYVMFEDWNGFVLSVQWVDVGKDAASPDDPVREGYSFREWDGDWKNVTDNRTVRAVYEGEPEQETESDPSSSEVEKE